MTEVDKFRRSQISDVKSIPQRGTMPGRAEEADRVIASPQRGIKPGGAIGGPNDMDDPFLGVVNRNERIIDDITAQPLNPELCRILRKKDPDYFHSKGVWSMRPIQEAWKKTGRPPISVGYVEVNKSGDGKSNDRMLFVAIEITIASEDSFWFGCAWFCRMRRPTSWMSG